MAFMGIETILEACLAFEAQSAQLYRDLQKGCHEPRAVQLLQTLIAAELDHVRRLQGLRAAPPPAGFVQFSAPAPTLPRPEALGAGRALTRSEVLQIARQVESEAETGYRRLAAAAPPGSIRDLFEALANLEHGHLDLVLREMTYD